MGTTIDFCYLLNKKGYAKAISKNKIQQRKAPVWVHIDYQKKENQKWLAEQNLSPSVLENLLDADTTPRYFKDEKGVLAVMRGINAKTESEDDMIAVHIWMSKNLLMTLSHRECPSIQQVVDRFITGSGPTSIQECFVALARQMNSQIEKTLVEIHEEGDSLEDAVISETTFKQDSILRHRLSRLRHKIVGLRRYLIPQREMMNKLVQDSVFEEQNKLNIQEIARDLTTVVSELDYAKDRSSVIQEELDAQTNIDISRTMYLMSLIMVIFTPLSFLTGLLGANVKGIPFGEHENGFLILSVVLVLFACVQVAIIKKAKWF